MSSSNRAIRALLAALLVLLAGHALAAPPVSGLRVGIATMKPGAIFFERFGHNSIVVVDPAEPEPISYNFGFFDPNEPNFYWRFVRGEMHYRLIALPFAQDLDYYRENGRGVTIQWLDLDASQSRSLAAALKENAKPEHARYRYNYFTDNCATRVRDAIDRAIGGVLGPQLKTRSRGNSFRSESVRLASPAWWMWLGFDIGLGPSADRPNSYWEDAFVPMRLADGLRLAKRADGRRLVLAEEEFLPHRIAPEPLESAFRWWRWLLAGAAIAVALVALAQRAPRLVATLALPFWSLSALLGALMLFIWLATEHDYGWANRNLLLFNPLCLLLLPDAWRLMRGRTSGAWFQYALLTVLLCALMALFLHWIPVAPQANAHWIALLLPIHAAFAYVFGSRPLRRSLSH